ncbi:MAG: hypothetical protein K6U74_03125 [Firmicutes bacterium]|nr:hypothetical protein [Bacillota bacterium]
MRKILMLVALFIFLRSAGVAYAGQDLKARTVEDLYGEYKNGNITLYWNSYVFRSTLPDPLGSDTIKIFRDDTNAAIWNNQIGSVNVNELSDPDLDSLRPNDPNSGKMEAFAFTDSNVEKGKTYSYKVSCGSTRYQVVSVTAQEGNSSTDDRRKAYEQQADWPERMASSLLIAILNYFIEMLGLYDPIDLIYQPNTTRDEQGQLKKTDTDKENLILYTFTGKEFEALSNYYNRLQNFVPISLVVVVVLMGLGVIYTSVNPNSRITAKEYFLGLLLGVALLKFGVFVLSVIFDINHTIVKYFEWMVGDSLKNNFLDTLINTDTVRLGQAIIAFVSVFSIGVINWQYVMRKIIIALLIGLIPLVAVISVIPSKRSALDYWFKEFIAQVFLQSAHAAVLSLGILLIQADNSNFWVELACIAGLPSIAVIVRRVIGAESLGGGFSGSLGAMIGLGSLFALGKMLSPGKFGKKLPGVAESPAAEGLARGAAGGAAALSVGGIAGRVAGFGFKAASTVGMATAGGLIAGAATGEFGPGVAGGAMLGAGLSGNIVNMANKAGSLLKMSPEEKAQAMGVADPALLDDPGEAYAAGKRLFGSGIMGKTISAGYAGLKSIQGLAGITNPRAAAQVKGVIADTQKGLSEAKAQLAEYKPVYEEAKANYTHAKNLYSPSSIHMKGLKDSVGQLEVQKNAAQIDYLEAVNPYNNELDRIGVLAEEDDYFDGEGYTLFPSYSHERVVRTESTYQEAASKVASVQNEIRTGEERYESSRKAFELAEAEHARRQAVVSGLERRLTTSGIRQEFEKIRKNQANTSSDVLWR